MRDYKMKWKCYEGGTKPVPALCCSHHKFSTDWSL